MIASFILYDELSCKEGYSFQSKEDYTINILCSTENLMIPLVLHGEAERIPGCSRNSKCGMMLKRNCEKTEGSIKLFQLEIVLNAPDDENADTHYHHAVYTSQTVSLLMQVGGFVTPIPLNTLPSRQGNGSWLWGFHDFTSSGKHSLLSPYRFGFANKREDLIKFVAFITDSSK